VNRILKTYSNYFFLTLLIVFLPLEHSLACQYCKPPTYKNAFKESTLVIVAHQIEKATVPNFAAKGFNFSEFDNSDDNKTKIKVDQILKGDSTKKNAILGVKARYGMCDYGLFLPDSKKYLIFLRKTKIGFETMACKPNLLEVKKGSIVINGKSMSLDEAVKSWQRK